MEANLQQCSNVYQESARVANRICALVAEGARYRDIVLVVCDYEDTAPIYIQAMQANGIPISVDISEKLIEYALIKYLRDCMQNAPWVKSLVRFKDAKVNALCKNIEDLIAQSDEALRDEIVIEKTKEILATIRNVLGGQSITVSEFNNMFCSLASACKISDVPKFLCIRTTTNKNLVIS